MDSKAAGKIIENVEKVIVGKRDSIELAVIALLAEGHLLVEDIPGVGKTVLAKTLARTLGCGFSRIQFTPDTLPSDVTGVSVYQMDSGTFRYVPGSIMNQIILADEINRATPKTQASLLEAMAEHQVSVDGKTYGLPAPFLVIATQNPVEELGTYPLPEAELDRFFMRLSLGYPSKEEEEEIVERFLFQKKVEEVEAVVTGEEILNMQEEVKGISIHRDLIGFVLKLAEQTRKSPELLLGASPRAVLALLRGAQASAFLEGRSYVNPDDILRVLYSVWCHRLLLTPEAKMEQKTQKDILMNIRNQIAIPV